MRKAQAWVFVTLLMAVAATGLFLGTSKAQPGPAERREERREQRREDRNYWRYHGGRWSHWDARDRRWYYTDGSHWYYHDGNRWQLYRFDRTFGREGFERGGYVPPRDEDVRGSLPRHEVYVGPR